MKKTETTIKLTSRIFSTIGFAALKKKIEAEGVRGGIKAFFWAQRTQKGDGGK